MNLRINTDGASRGNPGPASYGYIIKDKSGLIIHQEGKTIGVNTNNIAEYTAVLSALLYVQKYLIHKYPHEIEVVADSELVVRQLSGKYKVKNKNLFKLYSKIKELEQGLGPVKYKHVPRKENYIADKLANKALDNLQRI